MANLLYLFTLATPAVAAFIGQRAPLADTTTPTISVPSSLPTDASRNIDPSFPGYAFEIASLVEYATDANGNPNTFSQNLINAINSRTGGKPIIRFGGTSGDFVRFIPDQSEPALPVAAADNYQNVGNTTVGPSYWGLFNNFPNASFIFQVPIGINDPANAVSFTTSGIQTIGLDRIEAFEIGNEPDLYPNNNDDNVTLLPPQYQGEVTEQSYVSTFGAFASAISNALGLQPGPIFQAFDTSVHFDGSDASVLDVGTVFGNGLNVNGTIKTVSHHYYQTDGSEDLQLGLLNHSAIAGHLDLYRGFISYLQSSTTANGAPIPFIIGEIGNSLNRAHDYNYQAVLGSALWQVDFQLYAMTIGVARINWQQIMHSGFDFWLPVESAGIPAQTFASFYAQPYIADFISNNGGQTRVAQLQLTNAPDNFVAYAAYEGNTARRIAIVNLQEWDSSSATPRGVENVTISGLGTVNNVKVNVLSSPDGAHADASTITYAGSQWTYASGGNEVTGVRDDTQTIQAVNGAVTVPVDDSSAVLVYLNS